MPMSPQLKKILLIVSIILAVVLVILGLYYFFKYTPTGQNILGGITSTTPPTGLPSAQIRTSTLPSGTVGGGEQLPGGIDATNPSYYQPKLVTQLTTDQALFSSLNINGDLRYHNSADGKFYQILPDGSVKELADQVFFQVTNVTWAKNKNEAVLEFPDQSKIVYNFDTKKQVTLPKHWEDFSFSADGNELAAKSIGLAPENRWLIVTKNDGTETKLLEPIGDNVDKVNVSWSPSRQTVAFSQTGEPLGLDRREILLIGTQGENLKSLVIEGLDFVPQWSPSGQKLLYSIDSARTNFKPELWIVNAYGDTIGSDRQSLQINTWADKCSFGDDSTLFCAVPRDLPQGAGISPEINNSVDDLYKIDLKSGTKTGVALGEDFRISSISYDKNNNKVLFTDRFRPGVFEAKL